MRELAAGCESKQRAWCCLTTKHTTTSDLRTGYCSLTRHQFDHPISHQTCPFKELARDSQNLGTAVRGHGCCCPARGKSPGRLRGEAPCTQSPPAPTVLPPDSLDLQQVEGFVLCCCDLACPVSIGVHRKAIIPEAKFFCNLKEREERHG